MRLALCFFLHSILFSVTLAATRQPKKIVERLHLKLWTSPVCNHNRFCYPLFSSLWNSPYCYIPLIIRTQSRWAPKLAAHFLPILGGARVICCALRNRVRINFPPTPIKNARPISTPFCLQIAAFPCLPYIYAHYYVIFSPFSFDPFSPLFSSPLFPLPLLIACFPISRILRFPPFSPAFIFKTGRRGQDD